MITTDEQDPRTADLIRRWREGDLEARNTLISVIHAELSRIAAHLLHRNGRAQSLATGELVNEAVVKLLNSDNVNISDRGHLLALSARVMRQVLTDLARRRLAAKRHGNLITLTTREGAAAADPMFDVMALERALARLTALSPERAELVEMRYYAGMSIEEIAGVSGASASTVKRSWRITRAWLRDAIENDIGE